MQITTALGLSQVALGGLPTPSTKTSVLKKITQWFNRPYQSEAEVFLSQSVDRADFEYRERQLKYKGLL
jgi:hypothetical protein